MGIDPKELETPAGHEAPVAGPGTWAPNTIRGPVTLGPDQQQVFYTITGEDGISQQYMMICPKDMDQNTLITTLVRQASADPSIIGRKTIRITQHKTAQSDAP